MEETLPDSTSEYAEEGSLAHEIGELKVRKEFVEPMGPRTYMNKLKKLQANPLYKEEMLRHTDTYLNYIAGIIHGYTAPPHIAVEKKLSYGAYAPEGYGTTDCIIIGGNSMHVIDFKYGKVPVSAHENPQMMLYALGALLEYSILFNIGKVVLVIVQPRLESITECEMSESDLRYWATNTVMGAAEKAFKGEGDCVAGEHCRYCRAKALCRARADSNLSLEVFNYRKPPLLSNEEVGQILEKAQDLAKWAKAIAEYALNETLRGGDIPGWKAVEGRGSRSFTDIDEAFKSLIAKGYDEALLYKRVPLTAPQVEEVLGKEKYDELLTEYVLKSPGKPTLMATEDSRKSFQRYDLVEIFKNDMGVL